MAGVPSYVAFLRAINLGATRRFPKDDIRRCVESLGCTDVATHINTGNVLLTTPMRSRARIEARLEEAFLIDRGFEVPTIVLTLAELAHIVADADAVQTEMAEQAGAGAPYRQYVTLLKHEPASQAVAEIEGLRYAGERARVRGRVVHLTLTEKGYDQARLSNARIEKLLGVATTRDVKVIRALAQKWGPRPGE